MVTIRTLWGGKDLHPTWSRPPYINPSRYLSVSLSRFSMKQCTIYPVFERLAVCHDSDGLWLIICLSLVIEAFELYSAGILPFSLSAVLSHFIWSRLSSSFFARYFGSESSIFRHFGLHQVVDDYRYPSEKRSTSLLWVRSIVICFSDLLITWLTTSSAIQRVSYFVLNNDTSCSSQNSHVGCHFVVLR